MKRNDGFTMVELLVTIAAAAVVTIAAASLLLLGVRIQHASTEDASEQQSVRIILTMLEKMAGNGDIHSVYNDESGWMLKGEADAEGNAPTVLQYVVEKQTLYGAGDSVLLDGLNGAGARMDGKVLHFTFDTVRGGHYETAIYCRTGVNVSPAAEAVNGAVEGTKQKDFLAKLIEQYQNGQNVGRIVTMQGNPPKAQYGKYYSQWYIGDYGDQNPGWNEKTPWCACFLSWAAVESGAITVPEEEKNTLVPRDYSSPYVFANVDEGIKAFTLDDTPKVGDYVFFDWSGGTDPDHVGVVLNTTNEDGVDYIYTIEGNSGGVIAVRKYLKNSNAIIGYGTLPAFLPTPNPTDS